MKQHIMQELPVLPEPVGYQYLFHHHDGGKVWRDSVENWSGTSPIESRPVYTADQLQAYGAACAAHALDQIAEQYRAELDALSKRNYELRMDAAHAREVALSDAIDCYSPDDTYQDWADKINKLKAGK